MNTRHEMMCNVPNAGGCYVPSCACWCHKQPAEPTTQEAPAAADALLEQGTPEWHAAEAELHLAVADNLAAAAHDDPLVDAAVTRRLLAAQANAQLGTLKLALRADQGGELGRVETALQQLTAALAEHRNSWPRA